MHTTTPATARSHRPRALTVFGAALVAGAAAAFGVNTVLDAHLAAARPQVESDSILVAIRALPAGAPVTVWDVALKDWPKALVPAAEAVKTPLLLFSPVGYTWPRPRLPPTCSWYLPKWIELSSAGSGERIGKTIF